MCTVVRSTEKTLALFTQKSPGAMIRVLFVALTISKLVIKSTMFLVNRRAISEMWEKLSDKEFRAKNDREMK